MISTLISHQVDLWEAWVDLQAGERFATLYVIGNVYTDKRMTQPYFVKREQPDSSLLLLDIQPIVLSDEGFETEIMFAEELDSLCSYKTIEIYQGAELITRISEIETFC